MTTVVDPCSDVAAGEHLPGDLVDDLERVVRTREDALPHLGDSLRGERAPGLCRHGPARVGDLDLVAAPLCRCGALRRLRLLTLTGTLLQLAGLFRPQDVRAVTVDLHLGISSVA